MPGGKHLPGATPKAQRQYEHIKEGYLRKGVPVKAAKARAAATVNAQKPGRRGR